MRGAQAAAMERRMVANAGCPVEITLFDLNEKLMRKAWFFFQPRVGNPTWNMQYAFRGHMVVLCDENTASDGEAFAEGDGSVETLRFA